MKKLFTLLIAVSMLFSFSSCSNNTKITETAMCLDTIVTITCYGDSKTASEAAKAAISEIRRIEFLLSPYIDTSEIFNVNKNAHLSPVKVSDETFYVIKKALEFSEKTDGAFDITVKPLTELWNIKSETPVVPSDDMISDALSKVDYTNVVAENNTVFFKKEGMRIDPGGAAKGYAADKAAEVVKGAGINNAILDLGGNVYALGKSEKNAPWKIGLQDPSGERGKYFKAVELSDKTCVTSGSYERYFEKDGKIYHHILNPKTGYPADTGLISVSITGTSSFEADMLSTAVFVMGEDNFKKIKDRFQYESCIVVDKSNNWRVY